MRYARRASPVVLALLTALRAQAAAPIAPVDPQVLADKIQIEVAELRGLPFKRPVKAAVQSTEDFEEYVGTEMAKDMPDSIARHYGKIVRKLGLYRGPEIQNVVGMMQMVASSQAAAYYDPEKQTFYVLMQDMPEAMLGTFYAHELYHGLQDQYFDLQHYMARDASNVRLNSDELLARQAVVEGEAMYVMTLWGVKSMTGQRPARAVLAGAMQMQGQMDMESIRAMLKQPQMVGMMGDQMKASLEAIDRIPPFIIEGMMGAYLKGANFVFAVEEKGWSEVEKLYKEYPPASTEQILHPEKWFARESPSVITWPSFAGNPTLRGWELLDQNVIGEVQWRHVLKENGLGPKSMAVAAGWDGDRYAVFKRKDSDAMLLLLYTSWDSEAEATEFIDAYRELLKVKYAGANEPTRLERRGSDVLVVEGGDVSSLDSLMTLVRAAVKSKARQ